MILATSSMAARCLREGFATVIEDIRASYRWLIGMLQPASGKLTWLALGNDHAVCSRWVELLIAH